ncbi:MAG TPA: LysR family transcriptional regulator [Vineibacter sp.]|nr:LysR family transcriptional regulator [Vineibacter sp.]
MEPSWEHYRSFLTVLRHGSLSAAARTLKLTQPTIGRHIDELEQTLRLALFTRSRQGLTPTDAAVELRPHAEVMEAAAGALVRAASGAADQARGVVRLTASEIIGAEVLPPILATFRERHPEIAVELVLSNRTEDLLKREADIAVRMVRPSQAALVSRHLGHVTLGLHAHRRYLAAHGRPQTMDELTRHTIIGFDRESAVVRHLQDLGLTLTRELFALRSDSDLAQLAAIRAGFGIGACQIGIARRDAELVHLLPEHFAFQLGIWIAMHGNLRASRRMRLMFDHLATGLSDYIASARPRRRR